MSQRRMPPKILISMAPHVRVGKHDLKACGHHLFVGPAARIQKIGGLSSGLLDGVHGGHGQAGAVDHGAHIAGQAHVVYAQFPRLALQGVALLGVVQGGHVRMAFEGAFVKVHLGVQGHHVSGCGHGQRIDFHQHSVFFYGQAHQVLHQGRALVDLLRREPAAKEQLPRLEGPDMVAAVQSGGKDALWRARGTSSMSMPPVGRGHDRQALCAPVQHYGQVQLTGNVRALFYPDLMDLFAFWAGLVRHQLHAQNVSGSGLHRVQTFADLHAAALATAAGVDLRLDHPDRAGQGAGGRAGFGRRGRQRSVGTGTPNWASRPFAWYS